MSDDSLSLSPNSGRLTADRAGFVRAENARVGNWLATKWRQCLLALIILEIPLQVDIYFLHDLAESQWGAISGFNFSLTTICLVLLYLQWLPRMIVESSRFLGNGFLLAYLAVAGCSIVWAADRTLALFELFLLVQAFMIFIYIVNYIKTKTEVLFVMKFLLIGLIIQGFFMVATRILNDDIAIGRFNFEILNASQRVIGTFGSPNVASSYLALLLAPCLGLAFLPISKPWKLLALISVSLGSCGLVLTLSRGGWLAAGLSMAAFAIVAIGKRWLSPIASVTIVVLLTLFTIGFLPIVANRLLQDDGGSAAARMPLVELSALMIKENPLGVGANNWDTVASRHAEMTQFREAWYYTVHNKYLLVLAETGWAGLLAFMGFLISIVACGWRSIRHSGNSLAPLQLGLTAAFAGQTLHMFFDIFNSRAQMQMMCLVAALIVGISLIAESNDAETLDGPDWLAEHHPAEVGV